MASPFDRLMTTVRPHLVGAFDEAIRQELFIMLKEFFNRSDAWQETITFPLVAGTSTATLSPTVGSIRRLMGVLSPEGRPINGATISRANVLTMPFQASEAGLYGAVVSLTVSDPLSTDAYPIVPTDIIDTYLETLVAGIFSKMMAQPSKPYTNLNLAQMYRLSFNGGAARAKNEMRQGNAFGSQAWAFPQTFSNR